MHKFRTFESLKFRDFRLLWLGQLTTSSALWMDSTARGWLIYSLTGSALQLGLVSLVRGLPLLAFGVIAGAVADRYGRKNQLIIAQVTNAILNIILATLVLTHHIEVWHVYVTAALTGTVQAFEMPARQSLVNDLVDGEHLMNAVALTSSAFNISKMAGPALCGVLIALFSYDKSYGPAGTDITYYVQAGLFILATVWTIQMRIPKRSKQPGKMTESFFSSTKEGFSYVFRHRLILALMVLGLAPIFLGLPFMTLMPTFAVSIFHGDSRTQGILTAMVGAGAILGALIIASLGHRQASGKLLIAGAAGFGIFLIVFSRSPFLWMAVLFTFLIGLSNSAYTSQDQTIIQTLAPSELRGRILGIYNLNIGLMPIGSLLAGVMAQYLGPRSAVTIMGSGCLLIAIGVAIFIPAVLNINLDAQRKKLIDEQKAKKVMQEQVSDKDVSEK
ncbi:MAG: MFS transporter [Chloroflexi bacterium]|nr:MFS transporter [Chloroflexota bacterium]